MESSFVGVSACLVMRTRTRGCKAGDDDRYCGRVRDTTTKMPNHERERERAGRSVRRGGYEEAKALLQAALRVRTASLGPRHVETADTLLKLGGLERERGTTKEAETLYR